MVNVLAMPVVVGLKTAKERSPARPTAFTCEAMMGDGKALQMGTSHEFGQNFAKVFGIEFLDDTGAQQTACTTSWGVSTRMVGGLIMAHGDDNGLRVPPRLAAVQVVVIAVRDEGDVVARCRALVDELRAAGVRAELDDKTGGSLGRRVTDWELKGVPLRLEIGPRDLADNAATLAYRISGRAKASVALTGVVDTVLAVLEEEQSALLAEAIDLRESRTADVTTLDDAREGAATGWARVAWDRIGTEGEAELAQTGVTVRCLVRADGSLPDGDHEPDLVAYVARAY